MNNINQLYTTLFKIDLNNLKYMKYIHDSDATMENNTITFKNKETTVTFRQELAGKFNTDTNIWTWAWRMEQSSLDNTMANKLLNYALKIDNPNSDYMKTKIKMLLTASEISFTNKSELSHHLRVTNYLLYNYGVKFIYCINKKNENFYYYVYL